MFSLKRLIGLAAAAAVAFTLPLSASAAVLTEGGAPNPLVVTDPDGTVYSGAAIKTFTDEGEFIWQLNPVTNMTGRSIGTLLEVRGESLDNVTGIITGSDSTIFTPTSVSNEGDIARLRFSNLLFVGGVSYLASISFDIAGTQEVTGGFQVNVVPLPAPALLLLGGIGAIGFVRARRKKAAVAA